MQPELSSVYRLTLPGDSSQPVPQPSLVFTDAYSGTDNDGKYWPAPSVDGPNDYGYVDASGTLHAHSYNSDEDVTLEAGISSIFVLNTNYFYNALH